MKRLLCSLALLAISCSMPPAHADSEENPLETGSYTSDLDLKLGAGGIEAPAFLGSETRRKLLLPLVDVTFAKRFYLGSSRTGLGGGAGVYLYNERDLAWSVGVSGSQRREESFAPELAGMGDRPGGASIDSGLLWKQGIFRLSAGVAFGLHAGQGNSLKLGAGIGHLFDMRWLATFGLNAQIVNRQENNYDYGIDATQAAARAALIAAGDPRLRPGEAGPFTATGGLQSIGLGTSLTYLFDRHWSLTAFGGVSKLQGSALQSPLVRTDRGEALGLFLGYHF